LQLQAKRPSSRLILTSSLRKPATRAGAPITVDFALGGVARLVLDVGPGARTGGIPRSSGREGCGSLKCDGLLGRRAAGPGTSGIDLRAVAADGRAARGSIALTVK
jgi:hypothetical protein